MPDDVFMEFQEDPTPVRRICPDCTAEQTLLENDVPPPDGPNAAWKLLSCRGTIDWRLWRWCRLLGEVTQPKEGRRMNCDRRKAAR